MKPTRKQVTWSYAVYGAWFLIWVVLEVAGWKRARTRVPWVTLSETAWNLERTFTVARIVILAGLTVLAAHIVFGFPGSTPLP